jgi:hypothetical protein
MVDSTGWPPLVGVTDGMGQAMGGTGGVVAVTVGLCSEADLSLRTRHGRGVDSVESRICQLRSSCRDMAVGRSRCLTPSGHRSRGLSSPTVLDIGRGAPPPVTADADAAGGGRVGCAMLPPSVAIQMALKLGVGKSLRGWATPHAVGSDPPAQGAGGAHWARQTNRGRSGEMDSESDSD